MKEEKKRINGLVIIKSKNNYIKIIKSIARQKDADQLLKDAKELHAKADTLDITPKLMLQGSVDLLNEVSSKITGEEEIYSHTDLYDFKANIEGAQKFMNYSNLH